MKRKIIYSIILCTILVAISLNVFAAGSSSNMNNVGNQVSNAVEGTANVIGDGAEAVGNMTQDAVEGTGNVARSVTNGVVDAGKTVMNGTENVMRNDTNARGENTILGITNTAWMWIIIAIILAVLVWVIYKYMKEKNED